MFPALTVKFGHVWSPLMIANTIRNPRKLPKTALDVLLAKLTPQGRICLSLTGRLPYLRMPDIHWADFDKKHPRPDDPQLVYAGLWALFTDRRFWELVDKEDEVAVEAYAVSKTPRLPAWKRSDWRIIAKQDVKKITRAVEQISSNCARSILRASNTDEVDLAWLRESFLRFQTDKVWMIGRPKNPKLLIEFSKWVLIGLEDVPIPAACGKERRVRENHRPTAPQRCRNLWRVVDILRAEPNASKKSIEYELEKLAPDHDKDVKWDATIKEGRKLHTALISFISRTTST